MHSFESMPINPTERGPWTEKPPEDTLSKIKDGIIEYIMRKQKEKREKEKAKEAAQQEFKKEKVKESTAEKREKVEDEAANQRFDLFNNDILKRIFGKKESKESKKEGKTEEGEKKESRFIGSAEEWISDATDLAKAVKTGLEVYTGTTNKGEKLTPTERMVRGLGALGTWGSATVNLEMRYGGLLTKIKYGGVSDRETREKIIESGKQFEPYLKEMREFKINKGDATKGVENTAEDLKKEGDSKASKIFDKAAEIMRDNPEIVERVEQEATRVFREIFSPEKKVSETEPEASKEESGPGSETPEEEKA